MAKQNINVGTAANDKKGDSLRAAFQKVNANFTELYTELGLVNDVTLSLGAFEFAGSTISTTDSTDIVIDQATTVTSNLNVGGDILPSVANGGDLGSSTLPWRSLYVSNNTIFLGGTALSVNGAGNLLVNGSLITGGTTSYNDLSDKPNLGTYATQNDINTVLNEIDTRVTTLSYNDLLDKPNLAGTYQFSVAADDSTQRLVSTDEVIKFIGAGGITTSSDAEGNITITGTVIPTLATVATSGSYTDLINKPDLASTYQFSVAADDSTQRLISTDELIKFTGAGGITTSSDAEGYITITQGTTSSLVNGSSTVSLGSEGLLSLGASSGGIHANQTTGVITIGDNIAPNGAPYAPSTVIQVGGATNAFLISAYGPPARSWSFGMDGALTVPGDIKSSGNINIDINLTDSTLRRWQFGEDGDLILPTGTITSVSSGYGVRLVNYDYAADLVWQNGTTFTYGSTDVSSVKVDALGVGISVTQDGYATDKLWQFGPTGILTLPSGNSSSIQSVQNGNYQSKVTVSPFQILSQARTSQTQTYSAANGDFTTATSDGNGMITFVSPTGSVTEFIIDTIANGGVYERTVRLNGAGPEYEYAGFNGTDQVSLAIAAPAGAVTSIRFSYTRISKIDICPDEGVFRIESERGQDIDIDAGDDLQLIATDRTDITAGGNMRLRAGDGNVQITTNYGVPNATPMDWTFGTDGKLRLPNNTTLKDTAGNAIAFGYEAGLNSQSATAIAIGSSAGYYTQGAAAVAIGESAGESYQGANAIAIGFAAGYNNQAANSIILNATGNPLEQTTANTFTVAPIRNISATSGVLQYNASTKEVSYNLNVTAESFNTDQITVVGNRITTTVTNANLELECNGSGGVVINTLAEATTASTARSAGYLGIPASTVSTTATLTIADAGEHIYVTTNSQTITIPANASVAYPIGTTLTFIAGPSATTVTIAITSDTLRLAGGTSTGTRTLAANGMATAVKVAATTWYINGTGLT